MKLPTVKSYYPYSSSNYGANSLQVSFEKLELFYSYQTVISFIYAGNLVIRKNDWSNTTGKHLNEIDDDKSKRIEGKEFEKKLNLVLVELNLSVAEDEN